MEKEVEGARGRGGAAVVLLHRELDGGRRVGGVHEIGYTVAGGRRVSRRNFHKHVVGAGWREPPGVVGSKHGQGGPELGEQEARRPECKQ